MPGPAALSAELQGLLNKLMVLESEAKFLDTLAARLRNLIPRGIKTKGGLGGLGRTTSVEITLDNAVYNIESSDPQVLRVVRQPFSGGMRVGMPQPLSRSDWRISLVRDLDRMAESGEIPKSKLLRFLD